MNNRITFYSMWPGLLLVLLLMSYQSSAQTPANATIATATVVNSYPYFDGGVNTSLGGTNADPSSGCAATCCSTVVYRLEIPANGTLRGDMIPFQPLTGSMLVYTPDVPNPTDGSELTHVVQPGNFCGFRDSVEIANCQAGDVYYALIFGYNSQTSQGNTSIDITWQFFPDCDMGYSCAYLNETVCGSGGYNSPAGNLYTTSGNYVDTLFGAAMGGIDSLVYINLTIHSTEVTQDEFSDETLCPIDTLKHDGYTSYVPYVQFVQSQQQYINANNVVPSIAGTNRSAFCWMRQSTTVAGSSQQLIALNTSGGGNVTNLQIGTNEQLQLFDGGTSRSTGVVVTDGLWHFVGYTYDENNDSTKVYVDGVLALEFTNSQTVASNGLLSFGQEYDSGPSPSNFLNGEMTQVSIWNEVLDSVDIDLAMKAAITSSHPRYSNLQAYYAMFANCDQTTVFVDESVNGFDAVQVDANGFFEGFQVTDTMTMLPNFNASAHYNLEWSANGTPFSTAQSISETPVTIGSYETKYNRSYFTITEDWNVSIGGGCCTASASTISQIACDSLTSPSGNYIWSSSNTYMDTIPNAMGCDSVITVNLTINNGVNTSQTFTECDGGSVTVGTNTYNTSGTYTDVLMAANGCDSTVTTNLTVLAPITGSQTLSVCDGQSVTVGTNTYNTSGTYTDVLMAANGCDSTVTTNLTVLAPITGSQTLSVCDGQSVTVGTNTYNTSGTYTDVLMATNGCDSTVTTNLTVLAPITGSQTLSVCDGQSVTVGTNTYNTSGTYTDVLMAANGCDSTVTTNLTVLAPITGSQTLSVCDGQSVTVGTNTYNTSGTYTDVLMAANGCDSTVTTNLTVLAPITGSQTLSVCDGQSVTVGTNTYNTSGTYTDVLMAANGCDSTVTTNLTVMAPITGSQTLTVCDGQSVTVGTNTYNTTGTYTDVLMAANGCDSTVTTNLTVMAPITGSQTLTVCDGQSVTVGTNTYNTSGTYTDVLMAANGCDSTVTTNLTVLAPITGSQTLSVCDGQSVTVGTNTYTTTGTYTDVLMAANGCDSTVTTNLTVLAPSLATQSVTICAGSSYSIGGNTYFSAGTYVDTLTTSNGCDSTVTTNLTIDSLIAVQQTLNLCAGGSVSVGGNTYASTGIYTDTLTAAAGCDSVVTTDLTVAAPISQMQTLTLCAGDSVTVGSSSYHTTGVYTDVLTAVNGCDSTVTTDLTVQAPITSMQSLDLCAGQSVTVGSSTYSTTGVYTDILTAANGCDSTITTDLTVEAPVNTSISINNGIISADENGASYQWLDCDQNLEPIAGATNQSYDATAGGNFAVIVTVNGCSDTSACMMTTDVVALSGEKLQVNLYPNPTSGLVYVNLDGTPSQTQIYVRDLTGRLVASYATNGDPQITINTVSWQDGIYMIEVVAKTAHETIRLIKH